MDEIEISIERGSNEPPRRSSSEVSQINPRIAVAAAGVFILGLVMWLGAQTPARTTPTTVVPVTTMTLPETTTTEVQFAAPGPVRVTAAERVSPGPSMGEWLTDVEANPPDALAVLSSPVFLFVDEIGGGGHLLELGPERSQATALTCEGEPFDRLVGQLLGWLIFTTRSEMCMASFARPRETGVIPDMERFDSFIASGEDSGWFCDRGVGSHAMIVGFDLDLGTTEPRFGIQDCLFQADGDSMLLLDDQAKPFVWHVGDELEEDPTTYRAECEGAGGGFRYPGLGPRYEACRVGLQIELRDFFSDAVLSLPIESPTDVYWDVFVSPNGVRALARPYGSDVELSPYVVEFQTGVVTQLDSDIDVDRAAWMSDDELLTLTFPTQLGICSECSSDFELINFRLGLREPLLSFPFSPDVAYVQVLGS